MIDFAHGESPVGELMLAGDERHVSGLWMEGQKYFGATLPGGAVERENLPVFCACLLYTSTFRIGGQGTVYAQFRTGGKSVHGAQPGAVNRRCKKAQTLWAAGRLLQEKGIARTCSGVKVEKRRVSYRAKSPDTAAGFERRGIV